MSQVQAPPWSVRDALEMLYSSVRPELAQVEALLRKELRSDHAAVERVLRHGLRLGGKRLRPALLLLSGQAAGELNSDHVLLAAVMEMIHTATLVHDDVLDEASLRRHEETVNARWNNQTSILLGDFLFTHAFYLASTLESTWACRTIGRATNTVCDGELRQTASGGDLELSEEEYLQIIEAKTAQLCACCCELGARHAGAESEIVDALYAFGRDLGIAFQIVDDLLDLEGSESATGKSLGTDLAHLKMTLPLIHGRDVRRGPDRQHFLHLVASCEASSGGALMDALQRSESFDYAREQAVLYARLAGEHLAVLPASAAREALASLTHFVLARNG